MADMATIRRWLAVAGLALGSFVAFLDYAIIDTALPAIEHVYKANYIELEWVVNISLLVFASLLLLFGRIADVVGRRIFFYTGMIIYALASVGAGFSDWIWLVILCRGIQAVGLAMIVPTSLALTLETFPNAGRGLAVGVWGTVTGLGVAIGPAISGIIVTFLNWRWVFWIPAIIAVIGVLLSAGTVRRSESLSIGQKIDWWGGIVMIIGVSTLVVAMMQGDNWGWASWQSILLFSIALVFWIAFFFIEWASPEPLINLKYFANSTVISSTFAMVAQGAFIWVTLFLVPLYLYDFRDYKLYIVGFLMFIFTGLYLLLAPVVGWLIDRVGPKWIIVFGLLCFIVASIFQALFPADTALWIIILSYVFTGLGWVCTYIPVLSVIIVMLPQRSLATATGYMFTVQAVAGTIALAIAAALFNYEDYQVLKFSIGGGGFSLLPKDVTLHPGYVDSHLSSIVNHLAADTHKTALPLTKQAFEFGFHSVMWFIFAVSVVAFVLVLVLMRNQVKSRPLSYSIKDSIIEAEQRIRRHIRETPLEYSKMYSRLTGANVFFKMENLQYTGSFKIRGVFSRLLTFNEKQRKRGVVAASAGNHGLAVAYALHEMNMPGVVFVPEASPPSQVERIRDYGVEVQYAGVDQVVCEAYARRYANKHHMEFVSPYNEVNVVGGQGTIAIELMHQIDHIDAVFVPIGGGALSSGIAGYLRSASPDTEVIGCLPQNSPVMAESIKAGRIIEMDITPTLSNSTAGIIERDAITFDMCRALIRDYILVTEEEIKAAMVGFMESHHMLVEGSTGVAIAAFLKRQQQFQNKNVVIIACGANIDRDTLRLVICDH